MTIFVPKWTRLQVSLSDLLDWGPDDDDIASASPGVRQLASALGLPHDLDAFARAHLDPAPHAGTGDVFIFRHPAESQVLLLDLYQDQTDQLNIIQLSYRCSDESYAAALHAARSLFDQAEYPVTFEQAHVLEASRLATEPSSFPRDRHGYVQHLHEVAPSP